MALLNIDLGEDDKTINGTNADETNTVNVTGWGSHTLTVDGVSATVNSIIGVKAFSSPTFAAINGADLDINYGSLGINVLTGISYNVGDTSNISVKGPSILGLNLGTQTVNFSGDGAGSFTYQAGLIDTVTAFKVNGFSWSDSVGVKGYKFDAFSYDADTGIGRLTLKSGSILGGQDITFTLNGLDPDLAAEIMKDPSSYVDDDGNFVAPVCFLQGTLIDTDRGPVAVEHIRVGDKVHCLSGLREVRWVGHRHDWAHRIPENNRDAFWPVLIKQGAISDNVPNKDIRVSPWHHLYINEVLVRAKDLLNGSTILSDKTLKRISYFHVELDQFDVISAHGIYSESYADGGNRDFFHNVDITTLQPQDRVRRQAKRPGFHALRDQEAIVALRERFAQRAAQLEGDVVLLMNVA